MKYLVIPSFMALLLFGCNNNQADNTEEDLEVDTTATTIEPNDTVVIEVNESVDELDAEINATQQEVDQLLEDTEE